MSSCTWSTVDGPPLIRVPVGSVRYLPTIDPGCTETWTVVDAPGDNEVVHGFGGESRFVPDAAGIWTFALGEDQLDVEVVDHAPYHALFHPPSRSLLGVDGEVWAAQAYAPAVERLSLPDLQPAGEIAVGSWPVALAASPDERWVYVAQAGDDHLGVIDVAAGRMVDAIHVGDEPSGVVVSPDGTRAYVTLATATEIAVVDLEHRARTATLPAPPDARALALSSDGTRLAVAGHRTGAAERYPFGVDEGLDPDVMVVDTASGRVVATFPEVASTITDLELDEARGRLLVTGTRSFPERGLVDADAPPFEGVVTAWDLDTGALLDEIVLGPGGPATGMVLGPQALALDGDRLWVVAEGSSAAIALDAEDLHELARVPVDGQPRDVIMADGQVLSHGSQAFVVQALDTTGVLATGAAGTDPRPAEVAAGQVGFVSPGEQYGANYSCNSCHTDGRGDTRVWPAGPFAVWEASRAMFWLEGTAPLGWGGYVADVRAFGYTGYTSIIAKWPTTGMAEDLAAFLASLAPPAAANGQTRRSGALSEAGERGRAIYEGEAACASCHPAPRTTTNVTLADGITPDESSIPSLVGIYRHNRWLKRADATTLRDSVAEAASWSGVSLDDGQLDDLTRYLEELTDRDLFLLASEPLTDGPVGVDTPLVLTFNQPIWDDPANLAAIALEVDGQTRSATPIVDGRKVTLAPEAPLPWDADVVVTAAAGLEAFDGRALP
ncbi:MAG: hypothetical protein KC621_16215, partial [Myxococcales bacterium]|nr:hypothetical protein [Myxococcales bacterium]